MSELANSFSVISEQSIEANSSVGASPAPASLTSIATGREPVDPVGPYSWSLREAGARDIGAYLKRCLEGQHRGESGRDQINRLQSRVYIVVRDFDRKVCNPPLLLKAFTEVRSLCNRDGNCGESIFIGVPSFHEASFAVLGAGLQWPPSSR